MPKIYQNDVTAGRDFPRESGCAGDVVVTRTKTLLPVVGVDGDILEVGVLPARHYIVGINYREEGSLTEAKVGLMTGEVGDATFANRTVGANIVTSGRANDAALAITPVEFPRSIGVVVTAGTAGAAVHLDLLIAQG